MGSIYFALVTRGFTLKGSLSLECTEGKSVLEYANLCTVIT